MMIRKRAIGPIAAMFLVQPAFAETLKLSIHELKSAVDSATGQPILDIRLTNESKQAFADFTAARVGEQVQIRVGSRVLMDPVIREPIAGGRLIISGEFTTSSVKEVAAEIEAADKSLEIDGSDK